MLKNWKKHLRYAPDDAPFKLGTGGTVQILYETADANANALYVVFPDGGSVDVPAFMVGTAGLANKDLTLLNGITFGLLGVVDNDEDAYVGLTYGADDVPAIKSNKTLLSFLMGDVDDYVRIGTVSNIPTIYGTGAYLRIGDAGTTAYSLASEDDLMVTGQLEVQGVTYFTSALYCLGNLLISNSQALRINSTTTAHEFAVELYDVDGTAYIDILKFTNADDPTIEICPSGGFVGFFGATPVNQPGTIADASGCSGDADDKVNLIIDLLQELGLMA